MSEGDKDWDTVHTHPHTHTGVVTTVNPVELHFSRQATERDAYLSTTMATLEERARGACQQQWVS